MARRENFTVNVMDIEGAVTIASSGSLSNAGALTQTGAATFSGGIVQTGQQHIINTGAKVGATSTIGWALGGGAVDTGLMATLAASATADTLVVPIMGLKVGDIITAFTVHGQIESAGNTATLDADLRAMTAAAGDSTDASVGAITQISVTADTLVSTSKSALTHTVLAGNGYYVLLTATTAASTDIQLVAISVTTTSS